MSKGYSIFRRFSNVEQALALRDLLLISNIDSEIADNVAPVDVTFSGNTIQNQVELRINQNHFAQAESILEQNAKEIIDEISPDYYLFDFIDDELFEILLKADEWNAFDYTLAQKLLTKRGKPIDKELLNALKKQRIQDLAKPEENQKAWIVFGYFSAILGGFIGLIIGYFLWTAKKSLPNGQKVFSYAERDRKHGKYIFYIGLIVTPSAVLLRALV